MESSDSSTGGPWTDVYFVGARTKIGSEASFLDILLIHFQWCSFVSKTDHDN